MSAKVCTPLESLVVHKIYLMINYVYRYVGLFSVFWHNPQCHLSACWLPADIGFSPALNASDAAEL